MKWPGNRAAALKVLQLPLDKISTNPYQPRREFDKQSLEELAESIRRYGVVQPIIVRPLGGHYQLVAGERRLKASRIAGKSTIPALVRDLEDEAVMEIAFIENMHRRQLNRVEEVEGYMRIAQELGLRDPAAMAKRLGQSIAGLLEKNWILSMPPLLKRALVSQMIDEDVAKALATVKDEQKLKKILQALYAGKVKREDILARAAGKPTVKEAPEEPKLMTALKATPEATPMDLAIACFGVMREIIHAFSKKGLKVDIRDIRRPQEFGVEVTFKDPAAIKPTAKTTVSSKAPAPSQPGAKSRSISKAANHKTSPRAPAPEPSHPREETRKFQEFLKARSKKT